MQKSSLCLKVFLLLVLASMSVPGGARGQQGPIHLPPHELYRFHMGSTNGYYYTPWYSQGANAGYSFQYNVGFWVGARGGIYPNPQQGYTPDPAAGLLPLYQWTVIEGFRSYTHLSPYFGSHGSNYHFNGISGYVYPASTTVDPLFGLPTLKVSAWYSQSRGYWYGIGEPADGAYEYPPNWTYAFHGVAFRLPTATTATYPGACDSPPYCSGAQAVRYDPPPPPPECPIDEEQACYSSGGQWNPSTCACTLCDPWAEQSCYGQVGSRWDPSTCTCYQDNFYYH